VVGEHAVLDQPGAPLHDLAAAAKNRHDVAFTAAGRVEDRPQPVGNALRAGELLNRSVPLALILRVIPSVRDLGGVG
jgi:hypothetical protein